MKLVSITTTALLLMGLALTQPASALLGDTHDFEGFGHMTAITDQYPGYTYAGATTLCYPSYNHGGYPPTSGDCVVYSPSGNQITIDLLAPALSFAGDFSVAPGRAVTITLTLLDEPVADVDCTGAGYTFSTTCASTGTLFDGVVIDGPSNYFTMDTTVFGGLV